MPTTRVAVFLGTRPEAIKLAPVIRALEQAPGFEPVVISTGQHREMLDQVAQLFGLRIQHDLAVMRPNQALPELTARLLTACDELLARLQPELALVQGDTSTVLAAALACFYRRVPVGHVEAGLRTYDRWSPFPEEMNRTLASRLVTLHFAPTELARDNLLREGIAADAVSVTGNTVIDALQAEVARQQQPAVRAELTAQLARTLGSFPPPRPFVLITGHRRENFGRGFEQICAALAALAQRFADHDFIYPVHLNPNVQGPVQALLGGIGNIRLIAPQPYSEFVALMQSCRLVLTDSGGIQEEAPSLGKPVLVMRDTTERPEGVQAGTVQLVGADSAQIVDGVSRLLLDAEAYARMARAANPYGDGHAAERIVARLRQYLQAAGS
jgi:UDP-N-acetylglucosamine 2-epimerase (non-hydrolysing)